MTAMMAAMICARNFVPGLSETTSSIAPVATMMIAPSRMPRTSVVMSAKSSTLSRNPKKMASPPIRGIGWSWMCRL